MEMTLKPIRSAVPTFEPVTLAEAKSHLRIAKTNEEHHNDLDRLIQVAREAFESDTNYVLSTGTYTVKFECFPDEDELQLPIRPVSSITSLTYVDSAGTVQTFSSAYYSLNQYESMPTLQLVYPNVWPSTRGYENDNVLTFVAGYTTAALIPAQAKQAILLKIEQLFDGDPKGLVERAYEWIVKKYARSSYP